MTDEPVVIPTASRPARIAALHAAGLWLAENSTLPMPEKIDMIRHDGTLEQLRALSELSGEPIQTQGTSTWVTVPVTVEVLHGVTIEYTLFGPRLRSACTCSRPSDNYIPEAHEPGCGMFLTICACGMADGLRRGEQCPACQGTRRADEPQTSPTDLPPQGEGITSDPWADVMPSAGPAGSAHGPVDWRDA